MNFQVPSLFDVYFFRNVFLNFKKNEKENQFLSKYEKYDDRTVSQQALICKTNRRKLVVDNFSTIGKNINAQSHSCVMILRKGKQNLEPRTQNLLFG